MKSLCLILTRDNNEYVKLLSNNLSIDNKIIVDSEIYPKDLEDTNFFGLTQKVNNKTAWDKSFYYIHKHNLLLNYDFFYFLEDDVYCRNIKRFDLVFDILDNKYYYDLITHEINSKVNEPSWYWWNTLDLENLSKRYVSLFKSFNPFCRISSKLLEKIFEYQAANNKFNFHEILFPTLAYNNNLSMINIDKIKDVNNFFGIFTYRPIISMSNIKDDKIYHPVKPKYNNRYLYHDNDQQRLPKRQEKMNKIKKRIVIRKVKRKKR